MNKATETDSYNLADAPNLGHCQYPTSHESENFEHENISHITVSGWKLCDMVLAVTHNYDFRFLRG